MAYFIVSNTELSSDVMNPEVPKWYINTLEKHPENKRRALAEKWWGDFNTKRILLANSIDDALLVSFLTGGTPNKEGFIFEAFHVQANLLRKPTKEEEPMVQKVPLSWYTGRLKVKYRGKIARTIVDDKNDNFFLLRPEKPGEKNSPRIYISKYKWQWVEKAQ